MLYRHRSFLLVFCRTDTGPVQFSRQAERNLRYGPQDKPHVRRFSLCAFRCGTPWRRWSFCADGAGVQIRRQAVFPHGAGFLYGAPPSVSCRCGRRLMLSRPKLPVRVHILRYRGCFIFLFFFYGILPHWRLHFLPVLTGRKRSKGRNSRPRFRPKISPRRLPPRNSLPAVAQTSAPADATGRFFSRSAGTGLRSKGRGAAPVLVCVVHPCGRTSRMGVYFLIEGAGPHKNSVCVQNIRPSPFLEHELHGLRHSFRPPGKSVGRERGRRHASPA